MFSILFCLLSITPTDGYINQVETLEINHFYDEIGRLVFDQAIARQSDNHVQQWFLIKDGRPMDKTPDEVQAWEIKEKAAIGVKVPYVPPFNPRSLHISKDGKRYDIWIHANNMIYRISARTVYHTWTQHDPELLDREFFNKDDRVLLIPWSSN
jgi:hypothetical protein